MGLMNSTVFFFQFLQGNIGTDLLSGWPQVASFGGVSAAGNELSGVVMISGLSENKFKPTERSKHENLAKTLNIIEFY